MTVRRLTGLISLLAVAGTLGSFEVRAARQAAQDAQRPQFRIATNLVRVDAYPSQDGRIVQGLTATDFEVLENGVLQKIETFEYVEFPQRRPMEERRDPNSQREGFQLAADPSYRVFVLYLDNLHVDFKGSHAVRMPLITFLNQVLGPKDLFGVLTTAQGVNDLMLGQQTLMIEEQLTRYWDWGRGGRVVEDEGDLIVQACYGDEPGTAAELVRRRRIDEVFSDLEGIVAKLGEIREERKNILLVSNGWELPGRSAALRGSVRAMPPRIGVTDAGKLTLGRTNRHSIDPRACEDLLQRLSDMDFQQRLRDLLAMARLANVTFYALKPSGLVAPFSEINGRIVMDDRQYVDSLRVLSDNTDGIAVVSTNDLSGGARRIAQDLSGMYLLGYYPTNSQADGRIRRITVRLKRSGASVRARREYRAPTAEEIAALRDAVAAAATPSPPAASELALAELRRLRPGAVLHTRGSVIGDALVLTTELTAAEIEAGRWRSGGTLQVMVSDEAGNVVAAARTTLEAGARSAMTRIPVTGAPGPFTSTIRLRSDEHGSADDTFSIARSTSGFGDPLLYRGSTPAAMRPAGSVQFRRTERLEARWPITSEISDARARVLGRDGVPLELSVTTRTLNDDGALFFATTINLAPLTAGEYLLEVQAAGVPARMLAFRVAR